MVEPQFLMAQGTYHDESEHAAAPKVSHMRVGSATNKRSAIATYLKGVPTGDTAAVFLIDSTAKNLALAAVVNSYCFDYLMRLRLGGLHLDYHVFEQNPLILPSLSQGVETIGQLAATMALAGESFAAEWCELSGLYPSLRERPWRGWWALSEIDRIRNECVLNAVVARLYGLNNDDLAWLLQDCHHPQELIANKKFARTLNPKGFWRQDKNRPPELRRSVLTVVAAKELELRVENSGGDEVKALMDFAGIATEQPWDLPDSLRLADSGLGIEHTSLEKALVRDRVHDETILEAGYNDVERSWRECELHARNLSGEAGYRALQHRTPYEVGDVTMKRVAELEKPHYSRNRGQSELFDNGADALDQSELEP